MNSGPDRGEQEARDPGLEEVAELLLAVGRRLHAAQAAVMPQGVTHAQFFLMHRLAAHGRMTVAEAAAAMEVTPSAITALMGRLVRQGWVRRRRDGRDRRVVWLQLSEKGKEVLGACLKARHQAALSFLGELSAEERQRLAAICRRLLAAFAAGNRWPL
ncbi:MAG: MarR family transcriptional regulator [Clostridia bacterium]|nr:MarR family transcriptional regulator [Clostridia bacterium]